MMPKKMERELKAEARKKGLTGSKVDAYVYGTMTKKLNWHKSQKKGRG